MSNKWLTLIITVFSIFIPVVLYFISVTDKSLSYKVISNSSLASYSEGIDEIKIWFDSQEVKNISLMNLRVFNSGSESIRASDFEGPMTIDFGPEAKLLRINIKNQIPDNLPVNFTIDENQLIIDPLLMNAEDSFDIEVLITDEFLPEVNARIAGVKDISEIMNKHNYSARNYLSLFCAFCLVIFYGRCVSKLLLDRSHRFIRSFMGLVAAISAALLLKGIVGPFPIIEGKFFLPIFVILGVALGNLPPLIKRTNLR